MSDLDLSKVGNHFFLGLQPSTKLHDKDKYLLDAIRPAGIILYKSNFLHDCDYGAWLENQRQLVDDVRQYSGRQKLFVAIDHEGGRVCRTPHPITRFKSASEWSSSSREVGRAMGQELSSIGVNMNFAPVLDIHTNPVNPVIAERSFGSAADYVSECGVDFLQGMQENLVWACPKHFPGHGDTNVDSHYELPTLPHTESDLSKRELLPFEKSIHAGAEIIMTAHIMFPNIDPDLPATLSKKIISRLLRNQLKFEGVVVSDDIGMHAMDAFFDSKTSPKRFIEAGNDMLMVCAHWTDTQRVIDMATSITQALDDDDFRTMHHEPSIQRVDQLLDRTHMNEITTLPQRVFEKNRSIAGVYNQNTVEVI